ncbi:methylated-DNA--[protein]-cysteine S-methyltransferase [Bittarella massiliensis (ex Durand et al. 2017)]|uniref:methylated-DNA--[protein]-cysteine S-methyltransferase n=1 Tax=Bittarella massiliensis (ex Durand et al. 2017) TaxID=1720313 RepID=UPI00073E1D63|nr:methylated-DNA--[protein]-cysteine S-methyltransferase [Bittarella massiliensis (ex Durand et al. 2017)]
MQYTATYHSPLGGITLSSDGEHLCGLWFDGGKYFAATLDAEHHQRDLPVFEETRRWLDRYFQGAVPDFTPPLAPSGSPFRLAVWDVLLQIPRGQTVTYGEIAAALTRAQGRERMSAQAVGGAVGHNPISLIIPCHRVVGRDGSLTGYAGGIAKKAALLALEGVEMGGLFLPQRGTAL